MSPGRSGEVRVDRDDERDDGHRERQQRAHRERGEVLGRVGDERVNRLEEARARACRS